MDSFLPAVMGFVVGVFSVLMGAYSGRRAAKKQPKTVGRAQAYEDFISQVIDDPEHREQEAFQKVRARLLVYGETCVLEALAKYYNGGSKSFTALLPVISEMRRSLVTGHKSEAQNAIKALLQFEERVRNDNAVLPK